MELQQALREARNKAPYCVGWDQEKAEWVTYDPRNQLLGVQPQFYLGGKNLIPAPLDEISAQALASLVLETQPTNETNWSQKFKLFLHNWR